MAIAYNSNYDLTIPFSDVCVQLTLAANTVQSYTIPGDYNSIYSVKFGFNSSSNVFVGKNVSPTIPSSPTPGTQQYVEFKPGYDGSQRQVVGGDVLYFLTPDTTAYCGISLRQLQK